MACGLEVSLISFEALVDSGDAQAAVRRVRSADPPETGIYRGWMLRPSAYARLYEALRARGVTLINSPEAYRRCHWLPESYEVIAAHTPKSAWTRDCGIDAVMRLLEPFGHAPVIVKDYVKSQKHHWAEACYIPDAGDRSAVERVVARFLELQGPDLNEGLVFREFVALEPLTTHSKSGMPLTREYRFFFLDGAPLLSAPYWEEGEYLGSLPPLEPFRDVIPRVQSRFFTMDVARRTDGEWLIVELGDAQVAGLPDRADAREFYQSLMR